MTMREIDLEEAAGSLSRIVDSLQSEDHVVLTRAGKGVARLTMLSTRQTVRLGLAEGRFSVPDDFDAPLPSGVEALFYDSAIFPDERPVEEKLRSGRDSDG